MLVNHSLNFLDWSKILRSEIPTYIAAGISLKALQKTRPIGGIFAAAATGSGGGGVA